MIVALQIVNVQPMKLFWIPICSIFFGLVHIRLHIGHTLGVSSGSAGNDMSKIIKICIFMGVYWLVLVLGILISIFFCWGILVFGLLAPPGARMRVTHAYDASSRIVNGVLVNAFTNGIIAFTNGISICSIFFSWAFTNGICICSIFFSWWFTNVIRITDGQIALSSELAVSGIKYYWSCASSAFAGS